jgi:GxxExxY protein
MTSIIHKELSYTVRGVLLDVYNKLGPMLPERFYQEAIAYGLEAKGIHCQTEKSFEVYYRNNRVGLYAVDIWVEAGKIILELKVAPEIIPLHRAQALSYLKVTDADLAIIVCYGAASLLDERLPNFLRDKVADFKWENNTSGLTEDVLYPELINRLLEILHYVHFTLGPGFLHQVYRRATMIELQHQKLNYQYIKQLPLRYREHYLGTQEVRLIQVEDKVVLATVAVKQVDQAMQAQLKARLKHLGLQLGLLANFNATTLQLFIVR